MPGVIYVALVFDLDLEVVVAGYITIARAARHHKGVIGLKCIRPDVAIAGVVEIGISRFTGGNYVGWPCVDFQIRFIHVKF